MLKSCQNLTNLLRVSLRYNFDKKANIFTSSCLGYRCVKKDRKAKRNERKSRQGRQNMGFRAKNALVIGGCSGIGLASAHALLSAGCKHVIVAGKTEEKCNETSAILNQSHGENRASCICFDVAEEKEFEEALMYLVDKHSHLNVMVNSFGVFDGQDWEEEIFINSVCMIRSTLLGYDFMGVDSVGSGGIIINIAGTMGVEPMAGAATFAASKHAIVGFARSYGTPSLEAETNVKLVTLCPGVTNSKFWEGFEKRAMTDCDEDLRKYLNNAKKQEAKVCGQSVVYLVSNAETGSVWVIEGSQLYELKFPERRIYSTLVKQFS